MEFKSPEFLWFLLLIPALVIAYIIALRRRNKYALRYASLSLVKDAIGKGPGWRRHIPPILFLLALTWMILAAARPFGAITLIKHQATVILTIDVSGSMRATDLKPNRLEAAKAAARAFVELQDANTRIGVVSFSNMAAVVQAPTSDREAILAAINRLSTQRSTAIGEGILTSLTAIFEKPEDKVVSQSDVLGAPTPTPTPVAPGVHVPSTIILLTDGQNRTGTLPTEAARVAANRGVRVFTIGVGTTTGATIGPPPGAQDQFGGGPGGFGGGGGGFRSVLDEDTLKRVASLTEGQYYHASDEESLLAIYKNLDKEFVTEREQEETTVFFTGAALVFLLIGGILSIVWFNRLP
jgi:Ca-activated chloride channel family protein